MFSGRITHTALRFLDRIAPATDSPAHLRIGQRGEDDAYFYLRRRGYVMVARNYRNARHRGEIDLIGWDKDVLCFIEVKTRTTHDVKPAAAAVDRKKRHDLRAVIRDYLRTLPRRQFPEPPQWRFDVVTVYYENQAASLSGGKGLIRKHLARPSPSTDRSDPKTGTNPIGNKSLRRRAVPPTFELFQNAGLSS